MGVWLAWWRVIGRVEGVRRGRVRIIRILSSYLCLGICVKLRLSEKGVCLGVVVVSW